MSEYELLKTEALKNSDHIVQYNSILYASTAAILAFGFDSKNTNPLVFLLPYVVILPVYLLIEKERESICRISSYMIFFLEGSDYLWETRLDMDDKMGTLGFRMPSAKKSKFVEFISVYSHWPFILMPFICSSFSTYFVLLDNVQGTIGNIQVKWLAISAIWILFFLSLLIMILNVTQWGRFKEKFTEQWTNIKIEERKKRYKIGRYK